MKWKTIVIVLMLAALAGCQATMMPPDPKKAEAVEVSKEESTLLERIRQMEIIKQEQQLMRDILLLKVEVANIKTANAPPKPVIKE